MREAILDLLYISESFSINMTFEKGTLTPEDIVEIENNFGNVANTTISLYELYDEPYTLGLRIEHTMLKTSLTNNVKNKGVTND